MLLKTADDKAARVEMLENLAQLPIFDERPRSWIKKELGRLRKGIQGERESAYYLDRRYVDSNTHVLLHDLRVEADGEVAQIDHLLINRGGAFYLVETKNYAGNLVISGHGEFSVEYGDDSFGIPSPIEQGKRHEVVLRKVLGRLGLGARTLQPDVFHLVMLHPKATIQRPDPKLFDTRNVIKADQYDTWHQKFVDRLGTLTVFKAMANFRSLETIQEWGERLMAEHKPANLLQLPDFVEQAAVTAKSRSLPPHPAPLANRSNPPPAAAKPKVPTGPFEIEPAQEKVSSGFAPPGEKRLVCNTCGKKISFEEGKFCWAHAARFDGSQYCREHQSLFPPKRT